jgi:hypothetical protein
MGFWGECLNLGGGLNNKKLYNEELHKIFFSFGATAHIWALAYLHETFRFTSVY